MAIILSNLTFTDENDIVPPSGAEPILVSSLGATVNTLAGDDIINGGLEISTDPNIINNYSFLNFIGTLNTNSGNDLITGIYQNPYSTASNGSGIVNRGSLDPTEAGFATINTGDGNDTITGIYSNNDPNAFSGGSGIYNVIGLIDTGDGNDIVTGIADGYGIFTEIATIDTGNGDDIITAISGSTGIDSRITTINTGGGNDIITGTGGNGWGILLLSGAIDTGEGNDIINGTGHSGLVFHNANFNPLESRIDTGEGDDIITGAGSGDYGITNAGTVNTSNGKDSIISYGMLTNREMFLGEGDDSIIADIGSRGGSIENFYGHGIQNFQMIDTGDGKDIITSTGAIYNQGVIETGNGDDSIIVDGGIDNLTGTGYGIYNNGGAINTGDGSDSIIANQGFESAPNSGGAWFLGEGDDYIKGYGSGDFYGGNGNDTLELTPGTYTVGIWGEGGESPIFTKGDQLMITSEFEKLKAGSTIYDFTSLTAGQIIVVS